MAGADVIGTAICVALLIIVAYVIVGSIMTTTGVVINAQNDMNRQIEARLNTDIQIPDGPAPSFFWFESDKAYYIHFHVKNTGLEIIRNFTFMDVFLAESENAPKLYKFNASSVDSKGDPCGDANEKTWNYYEIVPNDIMNPGMLDPGEELSIDICKFGTAPPHFMVGAITPNGVSAFYTA
jgi:archaellum component FlaG (FlaF/FlaG flagellin family)